MSLFLIFISPCTLSFLCLPLTLRLPFTSSVLPSPPLPCCFASYFPPLPQWRFATWIPRVFVYRMSHHQIRHKSNSTSRSRWRCVPLSKTTPQATRALISSRSRASRPWHSQPTSSLFFSLSCDFEAKIKSLLLSYSLFSSTFPPFTHVGTHERIREFGQCFFFYS